MIATLIYIVIICGVLALAIWAIDALGTPEPVRRVVRVIAIVLAILMILALVANLFGVDTGMRVPPL